MSGPARPGVLVIDDERGFRELMQLEMGARGYDVRVAADGDVGLRALESRSFEVVLCDHTMPGLSGAALVKVLKRARPEAEIIMVTGFVPEEGLAELRAAGAREIVAKPFDMDDLAERIGRAARKEPVGGGEEGA